MYGEILTFFWFSRNNCHERISSGPRYSGDLLKCLANSATERRSEEHTSELQSPCNFVCRLLLDKILFTSYYSLLNRIILHSPLLRGGQVGLDRLYQSVCLRLMPMQYFLHSGNFFF